uniref:MATH domain-containing protein n=1 Tax=Rhabditophanes sp. KR3021 TaxID=114890 RepID=A0AC35TU49_9BILA
MPTLAQQPCDDQTTNSSTKKKFSLQALPPSPTINLTLNNNDPVTIIPPNLLPNSFGRRISSTPSSPRLVQKKETVKFRFLWTVKVALRRLSSHEVAIFHISPKFATVYNHISFQWTMKINGKANLNDDEENDDLKGEHDYVAVSIYYLDGPTTDVSLKARVRILREPSESLNKEEKKIEEKCDVKAHKGKETELTQSDRASISRHIKNNIGEVVKIGLMMEIDKSVFDRNTYLNIPSPTPFASFLTANYRARACSHIYKKRRALSSKSFKTDRKSIGKAAPHWKEIDYERIFNKVMTREREAREIQAEEIGKESELEELSPKTGPVVTFATATTESTANNNLSTEDGEEQYRDRRKSSSVVVDEVSSEHSTLFKKLLIACCDSCERRASIGPAASDDCQTDEDEFGNKLDSCKFHGNDQESEQESEEEEDGPTTFECCDERQAEIHDAMATMYFNRVALPLMAYVEDFADFLIDAELNDLPVMKRAVERYLCSEMITKRDIMTCLILDFLFLSMVFQLPVMKSMTLVEASERFEEIANIESLLEQDEYIRLDRRIQSMSERNLAELVDEIKKFKEQKNRVLHVDRKF